MFVVPLASLGLIYLAQRNGFISLSQANLWANVIIGSTIGGMTGAGVAGVGGSVVPVVGTTLGLVVGGLVGGVCGAAGGVVVHFWG